MVWRAVDDRNVCVAFIHFWMGKLKAEELKTEEAEEWVAQGAKTEEVSWSSCL